MRSIIPIENNPVLRQKSRPIHAHDISSHALKELISDMKALLTKEEYGVALAAPQVGEALRLFIVSGDATQRRRARYKETPEGSEIVDQVYINPSIVKMSRTKKDKHEGCLSIRGYWGMVPRSEKVTLRYTDEKGETKERGASGLLAHIFQHEMDHLDGTVYTDKATEVLEDESTAPARQAA